MPIGDLLAQIKGEAPKPSSAPSTSKGASVVKRKAEDDATGTASKIAKTAPSPAGPAPAPNVSSKPDRHLSTLPERGNSAKTEKRPFSSAPAASAKSRTPGSRENGPRNDGTKATATSSTSGPAPAPKKRSYAEIMQRATMLHQKLGPIGKIQHKSIKVTNPGVRDRENSHGESMTAARGAGSRKVGKSEIEDERAGLSSADERSKKGRGVHSGPGGHVSKSKASSGRPAERGDRGVGERKARKQPSPEPVKKAKKAAIATTGYKGTARPRVAPQNGPHSGKQSSSSAPGRAETGGRGTSRHGGLLATQRRRHEEDEDDMDDFIEYDDDGPQDGYNGRRAGSYESEEDESDMEAGFSDLEDENHRAALIARREDEEQEALERKHKREKEERKRKLLQGRR